MYVERFLISVSIIFLLSVTGACSDYEPHDDAVSAGTIDAVKDSENHDHESEDANSNDHAHDREMRQGGTHSHGDASLAIVVEGNTLFVELETPVYNLTGFEYAAQTVDEQAAVANAEKVLADPDQLFSINEEAGCVASVPEKRVSLSVAGAAESDPGHEHEHDESEHSAEHHHDGHESDADHSDNHKDVLVEFQFLCENPARLAEIDLVFFEIFPRFEELDVVFLDQTRQRTVTLNRSNFRLKLDH